MLFPAQAFKVEFPDLHSFESIDKSLESFLLPLLFCKVQGLMCRSWGVYLAQTHTHTQKERETGGNKDLGRFCSSDLKASDLPPVWTCSPVQDLYNGIGCNVSSGKHEATVLFRPIDIRGRRHPSELLSVLSISWLPPLMHFIFFSHGAGAEDSSLPMLRQAGHCIFNSLLQFLKEIY